MNKMELKKIIMSSKYSTKYEPILDVKNLNIFAYEALSKFETKFNEVSTEEIFKKLHSDNNLFFMLEKRNKELQVSCYPFPHKKLFLNFDADVCKNDEHQQYWKYFFEKSNDNIVVEITENGSDDEKSANVMRGFASWLENEKIDIALDDFAQEGSMFSFSILEKSKYIKIDKSFIRKISENINYKHYLKGVLDTIRLNGQISIIEGIETNEDMKLATELGCDYVQGYLFKNEMMIR